MLEAKTGFAERLYCIMPAFIFGLAKETRFSFLGPMFLEGHCKKCGGFVHENHYTGLDYAYELVDYGMGDTPRHKLAYTKSYVSSGPKYRL